MHNNFLHQPVLWAAFLLLFGQCTHRYYAPNTIQMPAFQAQHDANLNMGSVSGPDYSGYELQAAYSPIKYGLVMGNYFNAKSKREQTDYEGNLQSGKGNFAEIGLGGYYPINERSTISMTVAAGRGNVYNAYGKDRYANMYFNKWSVSPVIATRFKYVQMGFGLRLSSVAFRNGEIDWRIDESERIIIQEIEKRSPIFLPEYALSFGWRIGPVLLNNTMTYSPSAVSENLHFAGSNFNIGASIDIKNLWKLLKD